MLKIKARTTDDAGLSKITRNKIVTILDCRGDEDEGLEYLCEVGKFNTLRIWLSEDYIILD